LISPNKNKFDTDTDNNLAKADKTRILNRKNIFGCAHGPSGSPLATPVVPFPLPHSWLQHSKYQVIVVMMSSFEVCSVNIVAMFNL